MNKTFFGGSVGRFRAWACIYGFTLLTCGAPEWQEHYAPQPGTMLVERIREWALGERQRMVRKKSRTAAQLLVLPQHGTPKALLRRCVDARSLLPSSDNPREVYLVVDGKLYTVDTKAVQPRLVHIPIEPASVVLTHLLAMSRQAPPVVLLAMAQHDRNDRQASAPALWQLVVSGGRARAARYTDNPKLSDRDRFFQHFSAPRCREHSSDCLVIANRDNQSLLDVEAHPGGTRREWRTVQGTWIEDARWNPNDENSALLLVHCEKQSP